MSRLPVGLVVLVLYVVLDLEVSCHCKVVDQ